MSLQLWLIRWQNTGGVRNRTFVGLHSKLLLRLLLSFNNTYVNFKLHVIIDSFYWTATRTYFESTEQYFLAAVVVRHSVLSDSLRPHGLQHARLPVLHHLPEFAQTHVHQVGDAIQPSHLLLSPSPAFSLSSIRVFSKESGLRIRWTKYWRHSFSLSPFNEYSVLISFRIDWFDILAVQGTLNSWVSSSSHSESFELALNM